jgi:hypothetical protein
MRVIRELALPGPPRWAVYGDERDRVHVNIREPAEILVIDCAGLEVDGEFAVPAAGPHGLWLDGDRLLCAADEDALVVVELGSGEPVASLPFPAPPTSSCTTPISHGSCRDRRARRRLQLRQRSPRAGGGGRD